MQLLTNNRIQEIQMQSEVMQSCKGTNKVNEWNEVVLEKK